MGLGGVALSAHRVVVFAKGASTRRWIEEELDGEPETVVWTQSALAVAAVLTHVLQILVIDVDAIDEEDVVALEQVRDAGWAGRVIALGQVAPQLRRRLRVTHEIGRPFGSETLRVLVSRRPRDPGQPDRFTGPSLVVRQYLS